MYLSSNDVNVPSSFSTFSYWDWSGFISSVDNNVLLQEPIFGFYFFISFFVDFN